MHRENPEFNPQRGQMSTFFFPECLISYGGSYNCKSDEVAQTKGVERFDVASLEILRQIHPFQEQRPEPSYLYLTGLSWRALTVSRR